MNPKKIIKRHKKHHEKQELQKLIEKEIEDLTQTLPDKTSVPRPIFRVSDGL
jgi:hypothetical protein